MCFDNSASKLLLDLDLSDQVSWLSGPGIISKACLPRRKLKWHKCSGVSVFSVYNCASHQCI